MFKGGCCGAGSGAVFTASCGWAVAVERASSCHDDKLTSKARQHGIPWHRAVRIRRLLLIASPELTCHRLSASVHPRIRQTASIQASESGENGENTLDRLAHQGELAPSRKFAVVRPPSRFENHLFRFSFDFFFAFSEFSVTRWLDSFALLCRVLDGVFPGLRQKSSKNPVNP